MQAADAAAKAAKAAAEFEEHKAINAEVVARITAPYGECVQLLLQQVDTACERGRALLTPLGRSWRQPDMVSGQGLWRHLFHHVWLLLG